MSIDGVDVIHVDCRAVMFVYDHMPAPGDAFPMSSHVVGGDVRPGDALVCPRCGVSVRTFHKLADGNIAASW